MVSNNYISYAIIIQARLNSNRLKNKILKKIYRKFTVIEFLILRLLKKFDESKIIFALAKDQKNFKIKKILDRYKIKYFEGSEKNVFKRYLDCSRKFNTKNIIRVTSDCPLVDPFLIKKMYTYFRKKKLDYLSNTLPEKIKKYPDGADIEIFTIEALKKMSEMNLNRDDKEHVTNKFWSTKKFKTKIYPLKEDFSHYRYTIDYKTDILVVKYLINKIMKSKIFGNTTELVDIIKKNKKIEKIMRKNVVKQRFRRKKVFL